MFLYFSRAVCSLLSWGKTSRFLYIIFLVLVFGSLAGGAAFSAAAGGFIFHHGAVGLRRVADVVARLVHLVGPLVPVSVLIHSVEEDEDAEGGGRDDAHHHARGAAALAHHLRRAGEHLHLGERGARWWWGGRRTTILKSQNAFVAHTRRHTMS